MPVAAALQPFLQRRLVAGGLGFPGAVAALIGAAAELAVVAYLFLALRRVHGGSAPGTAVRTLGLFVAYMSVLAALGVLAVPALREAVWEAVAT